MEHRESNRVNSELSMSLYLLCFDGIEHALQNETLNRAYIQLQTINLIGQPVAYICLIKLAEYTGINNVGDGHGKLIQW